ncbi:MAG: LysR family transcriptional regulator [Devosiaceae bacterium]
MTLDQINTFLAIVRHGSVRAAADQMHITQPALSARLAALEASLATPLFERRKNGLVLTKAGADLVPYAHQMADLSGRIQTEITPRDQLTGQLRIGAAETIAQAWLPELISAVQARFPAITIEVSVDISVNLRDQLLDRSVDLALLMGPVSEYSIENVELPSFELGWFSSTNIGGRDDLGAVPVITYARNTRPFREVRTQLQERYGPAARIFPSSSLSACFEMVSAGLGVGVLPIRLAAERVAAGRLKSFDPGWSVSPLRFTASYLGGPTNSLAKEAAAIAQNVALSDQNN